MMEANMYIIIYFSILAAVVFSLSVFFICEAIKHIHQYRKIDPMYRAMINLQGEVDKLRHEVRTLRKQCNINHNNTPKAEDAEVEKD